MVSNSSPKLESTTLGRCALLVQSQRAKDAPQKSERGHKSQGNKGSKHSEKEVHSRGHPEPNKINLFNCHTQASESRRSNTSSSLLSVGLLGIFGCILCPAFTTQLSPNRHGRHRKHTRFTTLRRRHQRHPRSSKMSRAGTTAEDGSNAQQWESSSAGSACGLLILIQSVSVE